MSDFEQPVQPMSRAEAILRKYGDVTPMSRVEALLKELVDESGGSSVTVTPVLSEGVRLATIGVDGTNYNIYAPEDVVGSIVSVTTEYNTGTLLATITVNDVEHYIYVPEEEKEILTGFTTPSATLGNEGSLYVQYTGDQETEAETIWSGNEKWSYYQPQWKKIGDFNPLDYYRIGIRGNSNGMTVNTSELVSAILELSEQGSYWNASKRFGIKIEDDSLYAIQTYGSGSSNLYSVTGTNLIADGVEKAYSKTNGTWFPFPDNEGTEVIANPQDKATDTLNTVEIDGTIYDLPSGGGGGNLYGTDNPTSDLGDNGDIYMQYSAIGEEMDYETIWTGSVTSSQWLTPVQIGTINPSEYYRIKINGAYSKLVSELSEYGSGAEWNPAGHMWIYTRDNGTTLWLYSESGYTSTVTKVDATIYDERAVNKIEKTYCKIKDNWHEFGSVNYSTDEQVVGTWIDGKPLYQKTVIKNITTTGNAVISVADEFPTECTFRTFNGIVAYTYDGTYYTTSDISVRREGTVNGIKLNVGNNTLAYAITFTVRYTKTTD